MICVAFALAIASTAPVRAAQMNIVESFPAANATVSGESTQYSVRFDGPVDHERSRLWIAQHGNVLQLLAPRLNSAPSTLYSGARRLPAGDYELHWEVHSALDGSITTGFVPFKVAG